ncbi:nitrile hydratase subunit beta [Rhodoblastus sp.]|uniref:nitrile hydratase subunit beta n=1 Tax=Rhodoblastus sp. TaxID=1962975 RepID=UPI003F95B00C
MNGAHDLGGMMGFGPIAPEPNEPVFHCDWERRALALSLAAAACGEWNLDMVRYARESLPPAEYLTKSYYDIWITALEHLLVKAAMVTPEELRRGRASIPARPVRGKLAPADVEATLRKGTPYDRPPAAQALYREGETVRTKVMHPLTHTRLPRYARGKVGLVEEVRGYFAFPDSKARGAGDDPHWCYTVRFTGRELWGADADSTLSISIDAWEPYLERA